MPSVSRKQQRLMRAAEHGATFPKARDVRASMPMSSIRDFATGPVAPKRSAASNLGKWLHPAKKR